MFLRDDGKVQIGAQTQTSGGHTDFKLSVDGKIVARKLVSTEINWADDELLKNLTLDSLFQDEEFVNLYGHLNGIPLGKEVETNGIDFGQMSSMQMRKIERIYKYAFLLRKENEILKNKYSDLEKRIESLEKK